MHWNYRRIVVCQTAGVFVGGLIGVAALVWLGFWAGEPLRRTAALAIVLAGSAAIGGGLGSALWNLDRID